MDNRLRVAGRSSIHLCRDAFAGLISIATLVILCIVAQHIEVCAKRYLPHHDDGTVGMVSFAHALEQGPSRQCSCQGSEELCLWRTTRMNCCGTGTGAASIAVVIDTSTPNLHDDTPGGSLAATMSQTFINFEEGSDCMREYRDLPIALLVSRLYRDSTL